TDREEGRQLNRVCVKTRETAPSRSRLTLDDRVGSQQGAGVWYRWLRRPKSVWLRKALFQVHLWTGIALGLYVFAISVSGSAIVFRNELYALLWPGPRVVPISGPRLTHDQ